VPPLDPEQVCPDGLIYEKGDSDTDVTFDTIGGGVRSTTNEVGDRVNDAANAVGDFAGDAVDTIFGG
jgi:hypothetical protein